MKSMLYCVALVLSCISYCGCEGGGSSGPAEGVDVTGNWKGRSSAGVSFTANFVQQADGSLNGSARRQEGNTGAITGKVSGNGFSMHIIWTYGGTGDYEGTISGNAIEGTYDEILGSLNQTGTFTAFRQ